MCRPTYFAVDYAINPWMDPTRAGRHRAGHPPVGARCARPTSTSATRSTRSTRCPACPTWSSPPTARTVIDGRVLGVQFRDPRARRRGARPTGPGSSAPASRCTSRSTSTRARATSCSPATCCSPAPASAPRTPRTPSAQEVFGRPVITLQLVDPRFYHLDTALCVLDERTVAYLPEAFSPGSQAVLRRLFPDAVHRHHRPTPRCSGSTRSATAGTSCCPAQATGLAAALRERGLRHHRCRPVRAAQGRRRPQVLHPGGHVP